MSLSIISNARDAKGMQQTTPPRHNSDSEKQSETLGMACPSRDVLPSFFPSFLPSLLPSFLPSFLLPSREALFERSTFFMLHVRIVIALAAMKRHRSVVCKMVYERLNVLKKNNEQTEINSKINNLDYFVKKM